MTSMNRREFIRAGAGAATTLAMLSSSALAKTRKVKKGARKQVRKKKNRPNILLLYTDQHNGAIMRCAGHSEVITPHMDRLACEGVMFSRAYCPDGVCVPSCVVLDWR